MNPPAIAASPDQIDPQWMTAALRSAGVLKDGKVTDLVAKPVGNGLVGDSFRYSLSYDAPEPGAPETVVGKFAAADPTSRATGGAHQLYLKEVSFYREVAQTVDINTPRTFFADIDLATQDFTLIFEDLGPARAGDQLAGCTVEDARTALTEAAALHGPRWGDPTLADIPWLHATPEAAAMLIAALPMVVEAYKDRFKNDLEPEFMRLVEKLPETMAKFNAPSETPVTLQHGDYRLDNILFEVQGGKKRQGTLDWQTVAAGRGLVDVAYFLSAGLSYDERRAHERDLVRGYYDELTSRYGVTGYDWDTCWRDYGRFSVHGVMVGVFSAIAVERTERSDALFLKMTRGACVQCQDHGAFQAWA